MKSMLSSKDIPSGNFLFIPVMASKASPWPILISRLWSERSRCAILSSADPTDPVDYQCFTPGIPKIHLDLASFMCEGHEESCRRRRFVAWNRLGSPKKETYIHVSCTNHRDQSLFNQKLRRCDQGGSPACARDSRECQIRLDSGPRGPCR